MSFLHFSENSTVGHLLRMQRDLTFNKLGVIIIGKTACSNENTNEIRDQNPLLSVRTVCASPRCTTGLVHLRVWPVKPCYVFLRSKLCQNLCVWLIFHWWTVTGCVIYFRICRVVCFYYWWNLISKNLKLSLCKRRSDLILLITVWCYFY